MSFPRNLFFNVLTCLLALALLPALPIPARAVAGLGLPPTSYTRAEKKLFNFDFFSAESAFKKSEKDPRNDEYRTHARMLRLALLYSMADGMENLVGSLEKGRSNCAEADLQKFERAVSSLSKGIDDYYEQIGELAVALRDKDAEWEIIVDIRLNFDKLPLPGMTEEYLEKGDYRTELESEQYLTWYCKDKFVGLLEETVENKRGYNQSYVSYSGEMDIQHALYIVAEGCREHARYETARECYETVILMGVGDQFNKYRRLADSALKLLRREGKLPAE